MVSGIFSESTLFPKQEPIDVKQFQVPEVEKNCEKTSEACNDETVGDTKLLKRKKRIAFDVLPTIAEKKLKNQDVSDKLGFGFKSENLTSGCDNDTKKSFISFQKGEVAFIKCEEYPQNDNTENLEKLQEMKEILNEKVEFLCIDKDQLSPVQVILIQLNVSILETQLNL